MQHSVSLFSDKKNCCGCGACKNACPKKAISMKEDAYGFIYPYIDANLCVECGICQKVCSFQHQTVKNEPLAVFAAASKDKDMLRCSASGGAFSAIARIILSQGGIVFGAAFDKDWNVQHIGVETLEKLPRLQGSKYVQSHIGTTYQQVKKCLKEKRKVLFSGTPCQIAGLYGYLGHDDENLFTIDLICHGVPNQKMFQDYVHSLGNVEHFSFRDKSLGWGINGIAVIKGKRKALKLWQSDSPYLYYFSQGVIYRDSCYHCKYACKNRPADITVGDFWGIEKQHPEYLRQHIFHTKDGISVVIANTQKGMKLLNSCIFGLYIKKSDFEKVAAGNAQLVRPSICKSQRKEILDLYTKYGWNAVEERFYKNIGIRKYSSQLKSILPSGLKALLKRGRR